MQIQSKLASESHPAEDHHWQFTPECLKRMAEQAKGLPVTVNFDKTRRVGAVVGAEADVAGLMLTMDVDDSALASKVASPEFAAPENEWNADFSDRAIQSADLRGISFTDD